MVEQSKKPSNKTYKPFVFEPDALGFSSRLSKLSKELNGHFFNSLELE